MQAKIVTAVLLSFVLITASACGGGGSDDNLRTSLEEAEAALEKEREKTAQAEKQAAEEKEKREKAEADAKKADDAEAARKRAEDDAKKARDDAAEAERQRQAAEAERKRLADEAEKARQAANAAEAAIVLSGLTTIGHTLAATPSYRAAANLTTPNIEGKSAGSSGKWFRTTASQRSGASTQRVSLYSDVEAAKSVPFKDSSYNSDGSVVNAQGKVLPAGLNLGAELRKDVASGSFDRTSAPAKSFNIVDRGPNETEKATAQRAKADNDEARKNDPTIEPYDTSNPDYRLPVRNEARHPYRFSAEADGSLGGASGRFRCGASDSTADTSCKVQNTGGGFVFTGPWRFIPSSGTVGVKVADSEYMWFGWWSRESETSFALDTNHGGTGRLTAALTGVTGTATYNGIAVGHYAISGTLVADQGHGEFTAKARLTADFGANTVIGAITNFSGHPDWEVGLTGGTIANDASVTGSASSWTIGDDTEDLTTGTPWSANFYSNLPTGDRAGVQPYGIAGTFEATHGSAAKMAGAFGAHR